MTTTGRALAVVCLSLGGTKLQVGALTQEGVFLSAPEVLWRNDASFQEYLDHGYPIAFCTQLSRHIATFVEQQGFGLEDVDVVGIAFPGPRNDDKWFSNNLTPAFRNGVALESAMTRALGSVGSANISPEVRVVFDAVCDAGGELYHPRGRLFIEELASATVLNIATGIAAGYISDGRVLITDEDFNRSVADCYDAGAGQLGRHLWYAPGSGEWRYHYRERGQIPQAEGTRMTERLSGPALGGRLLYRMGGLPNLLSETWSDPDVPLSCVLDLYRNIKQLDPEDECASLAQQLRETSLPISTAMLRWADSCVSRDPVTSSAEGDAVSMLQDFCAEVAGELGAALETWMTAPGWAQYGRRIVLSGGVGMRFLASTDGQGPDGGFLGFLRRHLPRGCKLDRSQLINATERECYVFRWQPTVSTSVV